MKHALPRERNLTRSTAKLLELSRSDRESCLPGVSSRLTSFISYVMSGPVWYCFGLFQQ